MQLKMDVTKQQLIHLNKREFVVSDSVKYLTCVFNFSQEWFYCAKTALFDDTKGNVYSVLLIDDQCSVPYEVLSQDFTVSVFGVNGDMRITTNSVNIEVYQSGYKAGEAPQEPTPTVYEQISSQLNTLDIALSQHTENFENPHKVTPALIGLGNVDNTSDMDKPISAAVQTALDQKADKTLVSDEISKLSAVSHTHANMAVLNSITAENISVLNYAAQIFADFMADYAIETVFEGLTEKFIMKRFLGAAKYCVFLGETPLSANPISIAEPTVTASGILQSDSISVKLYDNNNALLCTAKPQTYSLQNKTFGRLECIL